MINIICGTCGTSKGYKTASDGDFSLPAAEEARLVARGVAAYVTKPIIGPAEAIAAPPVGPGVTAGGNDTPGQGNGPVAPKNGVAVPDSLRIVDGRFATEDLEQMTNASLSELAADLGLDTGKCRKKADFVALLAAVDLDEAEIDEGAGPDLSVNPIVP